MPASRGPLAPSEDVLQAEGAARASHPWAVSIVAKRFTDGLSHIFDRTFVGSRFQEFVNRSDPVYVTLLEGMNDLGVAQAVVGNWMMAHTLATQTRFWLEDAIVDLLVERSNQTEEPRPDVYSLHMLADGWYAAGRSLWDVGERWREEVHGRGAWRPPIQERALDEIERIVGEEERKFESLPPLQRRPALGEAPITPDDDKRSLARAAGALGGTARPIVVRCNLLVIEPERHDREPHTWAIRYINPTTFSQAATIKAERVNLLRLRAYLAQEKPFRAPGKIRVAIADLLPRRHADEASGRVSAHFSPLTRWSGTRLWEFLDVPFAAVTAGIRDAGGTMQKQLSEELRRLLDVRQPGEKSPAG